MSLKPVKKPLISLVAALSENRVIANTKINPPYHIPWHIPMDSKHFAEITRRHPVIMGRTTFETLPKPLPNRSNIIVTRQTDYQVFGCNVVDSLEKAIEWASVTETKEIFIVGGAQIYELALPLADRLYLTIVAGEIEGDVFFPDYLNFKTVLLEEEHEDNGYKFKYLNLER